MQDRTKPAPHYIVHDVSTGPQCRRPWEFLAHDPKVGRLTREDAIDGSWEHYDAIRADVLAELDRADPTVPIVAPIRTDPSNHSNGR